MHRVNLGLVVLVHVVDQLDAAVTKSNADERNGALLRHQLHVKRHG